MGASKSVRRVLSGILGVLLVVAVVFLAFGWIERERTRAEEYEVYSAYLSDGLLNDAHDWSASGPVRVVIGAKTTPGSNLRFRWLFLFDGRVKFDDLHAATRLSYVARNLFRTRIEPKFTLPKFATVSIQGDGESGAPEHQEKFPNSMGRVVLSGVGFNRSKTQAVFYIDHFCGLCGGGRYVLMEKRDGVWRIKGEHYTWIS